MVTEYYSNGSRGVELDHRAPRKALRGISNELKHIPTKKVALKAAHIGVTSTALFGSSRLIDVRDRALLLIGFSGAFRRSELVGIDCEHLSFEPDGLSIRILFSKTDQEGKGRHVQIPRRDSQATCPVVAIKEWLSISGINEGPVFRSISRHRHISDRAFREIGG